MYATRALRATATQHKFPLKPAEMTVDHLIVGGGVVGLAIAERLAKRFPEKSTFLVERHDSVGQETSSRNSEVVHAGLYYAPESLKTRFCRRGRELLYARCERDGIPYKKTGKLVLATESKQQILAVGRLFMHTQLPEVNVESWYLSGDEAREMESELSPDITCALWSPESGIVDSHALMSNLESSITSFPQASIALSTSVLQAVPMKPAFLPSDSSPSTFSSSNPGYLVQTQTASSLSPDHIHARTLILSSGLSTPHLYNSLLSPSSTHSPLTPYYCKGTYVSLSPSKLGAKHVSRLLYPCPEPGIEGLGTHLTLDLEGKVKFGPDVEWLGGKGQVGEREAREDPEGFWTRFLEPSEGRMEEMHRAIQTYLPGVELSSLTPDYAGIRPCIVPKGQPNPDYKIIHSDPTLPGLVALAGIGSPGLTSALAIGEAMERFFAKEVWKAEEGADQLGMKEGEEVIGDGGIPSEGVWKGKEWWETRETKKGFWGLW